MGYGNQGKSGEQLMDDAMQGKRCRRCGERKAVEEFQRTRKSAGGDDSKRSTICHACRARHYKTPFHGKTALHPHAAWLLREIGRG